MNPTKIMKCSCRSAFQDERYGAGMRVFNISQKKNEGKKNSKKEEESSSFSRTARCTVCGETKN